MIKYLVIRITIIASVILLLYYGAYFLLPQRYQDDQFSFIGELDAFFRLTAIFLILCLIGFGFETYRFHKLSSKMKVAGIALLFIIVIAILFLGWCILFL